MQALQAESYNRNPPPKWRLNGGTSLAGSVEIFDTSVQLCNHMHKHHGVKCKPRCQYCSEEFVRADRGDHHKKEILQRPGYVQQYSAPRAPRDSKLRTAKREEEAVTSNNGIPTHLAIKHSTVDFPRIDPEAELADRLVYRGEVWCRYPGCVRQVSVDQYSRELFFLNLYSLFPSQTNHLPRPDTCHSRLELSRCLISRKVYYTCYVLVYGLFALES